MPAAELPSRLLSIARTQDGVVTRAQALDAGLTPARWQGGAGGALQTLFRGCAVVTTLVGPEGITSRQTSRAATLSAGAGSPPYLCLGSALRALGIEGSPHRDAEHLLVEQGWHPRSGIVRHSFAVPEDSLCEIRGLVLTNARRSVFDALRTYDRAHAVSVMDSALHQRMISSCDLEAMAPLVSGQRARWLELTDPKAESPFETRAWLLFIDRNVAFQSQFEVQLPGFGRVRLDFKVGRRTAVECDGKGVHGEIAARYADSARDEALREVDIEALHLAWRDIEDRPDATLRRLERAEARGAVHHPVGVAAESNHIYAAAHGPGAGARWIP